MSDGLDTARGLIAEERDKKTGVFDWGNLCLTELLIELFELTDLHALKLVTVRERTRYRTAWPYCLIYGRHTDQRYWIDKVKSIVDRLLIAKVSLAQVIFLNSVSLVRILNV